MKNKTNLDEPVERERYGGRPDPANKWRNGKRSEGADGGTCLELLRRTVSFFFFNEGNVKTKV